MFRKLLCYYKCNCEFYSMVRKIVENDDLTTEANVSEIIAIQKMKNMTNDFFSKGNRGLTYTQLTSKLECRQNSR